VHDYQNNTDQLAIFFSSETLPQNELRKLIKKIREKVINNFGVNPEYLIPLSKQEIPKTSIGKIQRSQLTKRFESGEFNPILKEIDLLLENANTIPNWFYRQVWKPRNPVNLKSELSPQITLIFLDNLGLGSHLAAQLEAQNLPVITVIQGDKFAQLSSNQYQIKPAQKEDYQLLFDNLAQETNSIGNIIHLWNYQEYQGEITSTAQLEKAQEIGIYSLLFLIQSLAKIQDSNLTTALLFVSSYSQAVTANDEIAYEKSPVLGFLKSVNAEFSWLKSRHLDLTITSPKINSAYLLQELKVISQEKEIAYRDGKRLISGLEKVQLPQEKPQNLPFKKGGIYLITGGLGGIATEITQYLLKNYQARLLLIGKTPLPEKTEWTNYLNQNHPYSAKIQTLESLENLPGEVIYQSLDICDFSQLQETVTEVKKQWQGELDGIIHLAGIYQDGLILEQTQENLANILRPKTLGSWNLHQLLQETPGIFISFSSLASFFGGAAIASYAASNSFLEQLNHYHNAKNLFPSYCYSWTTWQETGISQGYQGQQLTRSQGYFEMTPQQGLNSFLASLYHDQNQLIIGLDSNNAKIKRFTSLAENSQQLTAYYTLKNGVNPVSLDSHLSLADCLETIYQCPLLLHQSFPLKDNDEIDKEQLLREIQGQDHQNWIAPRNETEFQISQIWQTVLNLPKVSINDNFFELGGHSLLASQVISRLRDVFSIELSLQNLLEYATIGDLAQAIEVIKTVNNNQIATTTIQEDYEEGEL
jgi:acyl carrier protein/NAD(P)-dependent dehydrogenase (short-subunit alcohol dehydrogenase family)